MPPPPPNSLPPPQTPTRALLQRLRRRSSLAPGQGGGGAPAAMPLSPLPLPLQPAQPTTPQSLRRAARSSLRNEISAEDQAESDDDDDDDEEEEEQPDSARVPTEEEMAQMDEEAVQAALEAQVDTLLNLAETKDRYILQLEAEKAALGKELREAKERIKLEEQRQAARERAGVKEKGGLTRQAAIQLEREFASQELILQGLQRDNERKTIEVEALRRKVRQMGEYLSSRHFGGSDDWEVAVFGSGSSSAAAAGSGGSGSVMGAGGSTVGPSTWGMSASGGNNTSNLTSSSLTGAIGLGDQSFGHPSSSGSRTSSNHQISPIARLLGAAAAGGPTPPSLIPLSALKDFGNTSASIDGSPRRGTKASGAVGDKENSGSGQSQTKDESPLKRGWKMEDGDGLDDASFVSAATDRENQSEDVRHASLEDEDTDEEEDGGEGMDGQGTSTAAGSRSKSETTSSNISTRSRKSLARSVTPTSTSSPAAAAAPPPPTSQSSGLQQLQLTSYDPSTLLASIESVRLLISGFERRNALRATELEEALKRANEAERRGLELLELYGEVGKRVKEGEGEGVGLRV